MTPIIRLSVSLMLLVFLAACGDSSYKKTKSGLAYKIISDKKNPVVKQGQVLKFEYTQKVRDSVLISWTENGPAYVPIDTTVPAEYNPAEIFPLLRKGDSAVVVIEADTIKSKGGQLPPFLKPKDKVFLLIKVKEVFQNEVEANKDRELVIQEMMKKQEAEAEVQKKIDLEVITQYLKSNNITAQSAPLGTLVEITTPGKGIACDSGKFVSVMYTGRTLAGKVFDSNIDSTFGHAGQPFTFMIGGRGAIKGWDDGLRMFRKGAKGRLFIPSAMAYGKRGAQPDILPNENLIFNVEVVDVSDKMPQSMMPVMPPMPDTSKSKK